MKIVILSSSDVRGGAARAAYRLHKALSSNGIDSYMLVQNKNSDDPKVIVSNRSLNFSFRRLRLRLDRLPLKFYPKRNNVLFSSAIVPFSDQ